MAKMRLLQTVCTVAMLTAAPAFAQSNTETGTTGAGGMSNTTGRQSGSDRMTPAGRAMGSHADMDRHSTNRSAMGHSGSAMHGRMSQDAAVDRLNEQSYQAAHSGQAFSGTGSSGGSGGTMPGGNMPPGGAEGNMPPGRTNGMNDMPGGSMPNVASPGK